jgi:hypothetical protein
MIAGRTAHGDSSTGSELKAGKEACREAYRTVEPLDDRQRKRRRFPRLAGNMAAEQDSKAKDQI